MTLATHPTAVEPFHLAIARTWAHFAPPPSLSISEWARAHRVLPQGTSPRPGPFRPEKFQIEMMDVLRDPHVHEVAIQKSTQLGVTDAVLFNVIGYYIHIDPKPIMYVQPTQDNAKDKGKKVITPMIKACPVLAERVRAATSRKAGNTLRLKEFPGGFLKLCGANAGADLRSDPAPVVLFDEVDGYPSDVDGEGDPIDIGTRRTDAYPDWKVVKVSTPAKPKGFSRIEKAAAAGDQRYFHVPCPFCGKKQALFWRDPDTEVFRLVYQVDADNQVVRSSVGYRCAGCDKVIPERYKPQMLAEGEWVAKFPGREIVSFYLNALYSPWRENWYDLAVEWVAARRDPEKLKAFINLRLGETWEEQGDSVEPHQLRKRVEKYSADVPKGVGLLTAAVDVQDDRLEVVVKGWGADEESWLIAYQQFFGDPGREEVWLECDRFLRTPFTHQSGRSMEIAGAMVDSGGHHTDSAYRFVKPRQAHHVFALKGSSESGKEILSKFSLNNQYHVKLYTIGTDTAKDRIFSRMRIPLPGPGYMHLPDWIEEEYLKQLTSEKRLHRYKKGRGMVREYVKTQARNEALDLEVYNLASLYTLATSGCASSGSSPSR